MIIPDNSSYPSSLPSGKRLCSLVLPAPALFPSRQGPLTYLFSSSASPLPLPSRSFHRWQTALSGICCSHSFHNLCSGTHPHSTVAVFLCTNSGYTYLYYSSSVRNPSEWISQIHYMSCNLIFQQPP